MRPEHFGKRNLFPNIYLEKRIYIYISKAIICLFSANMFWSNLCSKRKRPEVLQGMKWCFQQQDPFSKVAVWSVVPTITQVTDFKCHCYSATSAVSHMAKWQWEVFIFKVSLASVLYPYCKMFDSIGSYLSHFPLQKKKMFYQQSATALPLSWDRRDASASAWADVKA